MELKWLFTEALEAEGEGDVPALLPANAVLRREPLTSRRAQPRVSLIRLKITLIRNCRWEQGPDSAPDAAQTTVPRG